MWDAYEAQKDGHLPAGGAYGDQNPEILDAFTVLRAVERRIRREEENEREKRLLESFQALAGRG